MEGFMQQSTANTMPLNSISIAQAQSSEPTVLDLSCKKDNSRTLDLSVSCESGSTSPLSSGKHSEEEYPPRNYFEGLPLMPPSPIAPPEQTKYVVAYNYCNMAEGNVMGQLGGFPMLPMAVPLPTIPAMMPALYPPNHGAQMDRMDGNSTGLTTASPRTTSRTDSGSSSPEAYKKATRPFKAYPKDPLTFNVGDQLSNTDSNEAYLDFRKRMLDSVKQSNDTPNPKMRRVTKSSTQSFNGSDEKDAAYWERRRKNNEAAKRSRDARRAKEDELAIRTAFLEQENVRLKFEVEALKNEKAHLKYMLYRT